MKFKQKIEEHVERTTRAKAMGGAKKLAKRKDEGHLNVRERIDALLDPGSFRESGLFGTSYLPAMRDSTPADGKVTGFGKIAGRRVGVVGYDFTVKGSSSSFTNNRKMSHIKETGAKRGFPIVFLNESTGVRMPDMHHGRRHGTDRREHAFPAHARSALGDRHSRQCVRLRRTGMRAAHGFLHVMRKGAVMAVRKPARGVDVRSGVRVTARRTRRLAGARGAFRVCRSRRGYGRTAGAEADDTAFFELSANPPATNRRRARRCPRDRTSR